MISPIFEQLSDEYPAASFLKVDVDDQPDVAAAAQVAAMPTFQFFKSGKLLDKIVGADPVKLKTCVKNHSA
jgi:thioredoxin 1